MARCRRMKFPAIHPANDYPFYLYSSLRGTIWIFLSSVIKTSSPDRTSDQMKSPRQANGMVKALSVMSHRRCSGLKKQEPNWKHQ